MDGAVLRQVVVAADEGLQPQTREALELSVLLQLPTFVVPARGCCFSRPTSGT